MKTPMFLTLWSLLSPTGTLIHVEHECHSETSDTFVDGSLVELAYYHINSYPDEQEGSNVQCEILKLNRHLLHLPNLFELRFFLGPQRTVRRT